MKRYGSAVLGILLAVSLTALFSPVSAVSPTDGPEEPSIAGPQDIDEEEANDPPNRSSGSTLDARTPVERGSALDDTGGLQAGSSEAVGSMVGWLADHGLWMVGAIALVGAQRAWRKGGHEGDPTPPSDALQRPGPEGAMLMGNRALQRGDADIAEQWFASALELDDELAIAALCRGLCHLEMGQPGEARSWLSRTCDLEPGNATARYHLARAQALDDAEREAVRTLGPLVRARPEIVSDVHEDPVFAGVCRQSPWGRLVEEVT